ncbi:hypothetical protein [Psychroserpens luteus]|uniref:Uncharacterized protein n=1 Tax=Psychroserpens luteus TaxID=1434066 RepID=A0ABW5ZVN7_9FLAO|nr:hypothetical protein [Psychroserpens luteus]
MKYTEEQITNKAKQVMKDLDGQFYTEECIDGILFKENETVGYGRFEGKQKSIWTVHINAIFDNIDLLFLSDETGEPLYYHNFNMILFEIEKDNKGVYSKKED